MSKFDRGVFVVATPETLIPTVANWIFVDQERDLVYQIDALTGQWTVYDTDTQTPVRGGAMDAEVAEAVCRQAYLALGPQAPSH